MPARASDCVSLCLLCVVLSISFWCLLASVTCWFPVVVLLCFLQSLRLWVALSLGLSVSLRLCPSLSLYKALCLHPRVVRKHYLRMWAGSLCQPGARPFRIPEPFNNTCFCDARRLAMDRPEAERRSDLVDALALCIANRPQIVQSRCRRISSSLWPRRPAWSQAPTCRRGNGRSSAICVLLSSCLVLGLLVLVRDWCGFGGAVAFRPGRISGH